MEKTVKISTAIAFTTSIIVILSTLAVTTYSIFFIHSIFGYFVGKEDIYKQLVLFNDNLRILFFALLIFGFIVSYYLTKMLINPLLDFVDGTKEISEGRFDHRLKPTAYVEINEMVKTYNKMAENLENLYSKLDQKVKERTKELEIANQELKTAQVMMVHSEKMRSLGQLVAGITHEINNPINFVYGNIIHLKKYVQALFEIIDLYEALEVNLNEEQLKELKEVKKKIDIEFIKQDLPMLIDSCYTGTERTKNIIMDLKNFSRFDEMVVNDIDLKKEIETTLNILHNKIKGKIEIIKEYDEQIPLIQGYGGQLNQVFMNILDNSCYAIKESGKIYIRIQKTQKDVIMEFEDTGCGISKAQLEHIFEPFYTTKPVGEGTGLGMSISYQVIKNHNGLITLNSEEGKGTIIRIQLPINIQKD